MEKVVQATAEESLRYFVRLTTRMQSQAGNNRKGTLTIFGSGMSVKQTGCSEW